MPLEPTGETPLSDACPFCGETVASDDARAANVRVRPIHGRTTVGFTPRWDCLASAFEPIRQRRAVASLWADWFAAPGPR